MLKEIVLNAEDMKQLQKVVDQKVGLDLLVKRLYEHLGIVERELWEELRKIYPDAVRLEHPTAGEWKVYVRIP